ncbi:hypothetical protein SDC9_164452 [bioreactor metagenome]|uniref:Uncharacterized protein n=1 Tax=bioreactor metagenome TaxID=1076179 RepID=A0A645FTY0_9ZZZZ
MEERQANRARRGQVGQRIRRGPPGLAHRVLGHELRTAGRDLRHPRGWRGPAVSAPRKRDRAERRRHGQAVCQDLDAQRLHQRGQREDVQVAGQLLHHPRRAQRVRRRDGALLRRARALSQPAELQQRAPGRRAQRPQAPVHRAEPGACG